MTDAPVWLSGPPGAGKTTLCGSYLDARNLPALWYQVDAGDEDPASFFYFLGKAARQAGLDDAIRLPLLTPEYLPDLPGFARRYFRLLWEGLPRPLALILDNYQELPERAPLQAALSEVLGEGPADVAVIVVSRGEPPPQFARLRASRKLVLLGWEDLRLTTEDAAQISAKARNREVPGIEALVERCGGWVAGLILLLEHMDASEAAHEAPQSREALFDYFATELFDRLPPETRHLLLRTALLSRVSVEFAEALTGNSKAGTLLAALRRRHLFTELRAGSTPTYEYHALFKEFLAHRVKETYTTSEYLRLSHKSAVLLAKAGEHGAAIQLYLSAGDHPSAADVILQQAPTVAAQGRLQMLEGWIAALPASLVDETPWLIFWQGVCRMARDPVAARAVLERAFDGFAAAGDIKGQIQAAARIFEAKQMTWFVWPADDPWIERLERLLDLEPEFPDPSDELLVHATLIAATLFTGTGRPRLERSMARAQALIHCASDVNVRLFAADALLNAFEYSGALREAIAFIASMEAYCDDPALTPFHLIHWRGRSFFVLSLAGAWDEGIAAHEVTIETAEREGLAILMPISLLAGAVTRLFAGDAAGVRHYAARARPVLDERPSIKSWYAGMLTGAAIIERDRETVLRYMEPMYKEMLRSGAGLFVVNAALGRIYAYCFLGRYEEAIATAEDMRKYTRALSPEGTQYDERIPEAYALLKLGRPDAAAALLRESLHLWAKRGYVTTTFWIPWLMSELYAFALERGIETEYVTHLIRLRGLAPPPGATAWVWPVQIRTLGRFEILLDGKPLEMGRKAPKKLLAFLKALIALGGENVPERKLADTLYPDHDGDRAQELLATGLHRVRKLLGDTNAILRAEGRLSLNPARVWLDVRAFERLSQEPGAAETALSLYRGDFLSEEADASWAASTRERLSRRFVRLLVANGARFEALQDHAVAAALYGRGVEAAPLAEELYQGLMRCYKAERREAEALTVYRQLEQALSVVSSAPSQVTRALYRLLGAHLIFFGWQELFAPYLQLPGL